MQPKRIAIIPARSGSVRIKNKNIKSFFNKPMISYPIDALKKSKLFEKIHISTDDTKIKKIVEKLGIKFDFLKNFSQHIYLLMKAKIRRFGKEGKYYKNIEKKIPGYNNKKLVGLAKRYEDKKIKRDIKNNKLKLLKGDKKIVRDRS